MYGMQVMPSTARAPGFGLAPADPNNPQDMDRLGREYRAKMQERFGGNLAQMWAGYNAGPGATSRAIGTYGDGWLQHLPAETQNYVRKNLSAYQRGS